MRPKPRPPEGMKLNELSEAVFEVLSEHTIFPWPVLKTQAKRLELDAAALKVADLERLIEPLASGVERFTSPEAGAAVGRQLRKLLERR